MLHTLKGKEFAIAKLKERRERPVERVDNANLYAGSPMYYYCKSCGYTAAVLPEGHWGAPPKLCDQCQALKDLGWLE